MVDRKKAVEAIQKAVATANFDKIAFKVEEIKAESVDVNKIYEELIAPAKDAEYKYEDGEVKIVDEKVKVIVDKQKLKQAFESDAEGVTITVETEVPEVTAVQLKEMREKHGILYVLENVCKLDANGTLAKLILSKVEEIKKWGWIQ